MRPAVKSLLIRPSPEAQAAPSAEQTAPWAVHRSHVPRSRWIAIVLVLSGCLPLVFWHFVGLVQRPHYQFVVLLPIAAALLVFRHRQRVSNDIRPLAPAPLMALLVAIGGLAAATYLWSPWLGMVSSMLAIYTCLWWAGGQSGLRAWLPAWILCWLAVPLPFGLDEDLILTLRTSTTRMASAVLDEIGILHLSYANVIELPLKPLFIADACSGIHSLYVLLGVALFLAMWQERGVLHTLILLAATLVLVLIENVARIVIIAAGFNWRMDLSEGADHVLLGFMLFAVSVGLVASTDQLLWFLLPRGSIVPVGSRKGAYYEERKRKSGSVPVWSSLGWAAALALAVIFPVIGAAEVYRMPKQLPGLNAVWSGAYELPQFGEDALPDELAGFRRTKYTTIKRVAGDPLGHESQQWTYQARSATALISLDYPYGGVHDLSVCYTAIGWSILDKRVMSPAELAGMPGGEQGPVAVVQLERPLHGNAVLMFSLADRNGNIDAVIKDLARGDATDRVNDRFAAVPQTQAGAWQAVSPKAPYVQFQLLMRVNGPLDERQIDALAAMYCQARQLLAGRVESAGSSPAGNSQD